MKRTLAVMVLSLCAATASGAPPPPIPFDLSCAISAPMKGSTRIRWTGSTLTVSSPMSEQPSVWQGPSVDVFVAPGQGRSYTYWFRTESDGRTQYRNVSVFFGKTGDVFLASYEHAEVRKELLMGAGKLFLSQCATTLIREAHNQP